MSLHKLQMDYQIAEIEEKERKERLKKDLEKARKRAIRQGIQQGMQQGIQQGQQVLIDLLKSGKTLDEAEKILGIK
jgi:flagellar biosynthesis/type III secretory pathway protein FliH